jgi:ribonuclease HI
MPKINIYTDGSCSGNPGPAGAGAVLEWKGKTKEICTPLGIGTNNIAELQAVALALAAIKTPVKKKCELTIYSDSQYAIGVLSKGHKINANVALVLSIKTTFGDFKSVKFVKIKGHCGNRFNELADTLAKAGVARNGVEVWA